MAILARRARLSEVTLRVLIMGPFVAVLSALSSAERHS